MTNRVLKTLLICVMLVVLSACAPIQYRAYEGSSLPPNEVAILSIDRSTFIRSVDGKETGLTVYGVGEMGADIEITQGPHLLSVAFHRMAMSTFGSAKTYSGWVDVQYAFMKGRRYELHYTIKESVFKPVIVDVTNAPSRKANWANWGEL